MNKKMYELGSKRSVIRELFEYGKEYAEVHGKDSVFDFTIGNPNIPAPHTVNDLIKQAVDNPDIHLYTSAEGDKKVRKKVKKRSFSFYGCFLKYFFLRLVWVVKAYLFFPIYVRRIYEMLSKGSK